MERLFIRCQEDRTELKEISDYAKKHKERMVPLAHSQLLYLDVLAGRPMEGPNWENEELNRSQVRGPSIQKLEQRLGKSIRSYVIDLLNRGLGDWRIDA